MSETRDFIDLKLDEGSEDEKAIFSLNRELAVDFFSKIPLHHRYIPKMSRGFRSYLTENIISIPQTQLRDNLKEDIINRIDAVESKGEVSLSREMFLDVLKEFHLNNRAYRACFYAMNSAYYKSGAETYFSDIACLKVEEYSVFKTNIFSDESNRIIVAYDPLLFQHVLYCHNITDKDIDSLDHLNLMALRKTQEFVIFKELYYKMCDLMQKTTMASSRLSKKQLEKFKKALIQTIESRYHLERKRLDRWFHAENFGGALLLGGLGFALGGPIGSGVGAALGFTPPLLRLAGLGAAENIARKLSMKNYNYYFYLDMLQEKIGRLHDEMDIEED